MASAKVGTTAENGNELFAFELWRGGDAARALSLADLGNNDLCAHALDTGNRCEDTAALRIKCGPLVSPAPCLSSSAMRAPRGSDAIRSMDPSRLFRCRG